MDYISPIAARRMTGLRLALTAHYDAPWCEAAKAFFRFRNVDFLPVEQVPFEPNAELVAWTGFSNAPVAVFDDEPPRAHWLEIAFLAERLGSGPSLLPFCQRERMLCLGISTEIASENGFGWTCRMLTFNQLWGSGPLPTSAPTSAAEGRRRYGYTSTAAADARERLVRILGGLSDQLHAQRRLGSRYFVGNEISVADILWATFATFVAPPPADISAMPEGQRNLYRNNGRIIEGAIDPILLSHRDWMFESCIRTPLSF